ncbi:Rha family transcriptional regulator [Ruminococcus intestinalis]|uniref:Rha family transcriptional regulator n=1 Tax=Ruminococcus intestinalis TaxID=2763066 RepID=UPI003F7D9DEA
MTSREIAEVTGKEHKNVLAAIRLMEGAWGKVTGLSFKLSEYTDSTGRKLPMYELTKTECLYIATKFNDEARAKLVIRWEELETKERQNVPALPQTYLEALKALVLSEEQKQVLALENESMKPKADYFDTLVERGSNLNLRDTAKMIGVSERFFIEYLLLNGYLYRDAKRKLKPIAKYVGKYFVLKEWVRGENTGSQTLVTVEGKDRFYKLINK